jgi:hypothetical protein
MGPIPIVERDTFRGSPYPAQTSKSLTSSLERQRVNSIGFPLVSALLCTGHGRGLLGFSAARGIIYRALGGSVLHKRRQAVLTGPSGRDTGLFVTV